MISMHVLLLLLSSPAVLSFKWTIFCKAKAVSLLWNNSHTSSCYYSLGWLAVPFNNTIRQGRHWLQLFLWLEGRKPLPFLWHSACCTELLLRGDSHALVS